MNLRPAAMSMRHRMTCRMPFTGDFLCCSHSLGACLSKVSRSQSSMRIRVCRLFDSPHRVITRKQVTTFGWLVAALIIASRSMHPVDVWLPGSWSMTLTAMLTPSHLARNTLPKDPDPSRRPISRLPETVSIGYLDLSRQSVSFVRPGPGSAPAPEVVQGGPHLPPAIKRPRSCMWKIRSHGEPFLIRLKLGCRGA